MPHSDPIKRAEYQRGYRLRPEYKAKRAASVANRRDRIRAQKRAAYQSLDAAARKRTSEQRRANYLKSVYGVSVEQYDRMLATQAGVCAVCHKPPKRGRLHVDHDHKTGRVRGLLCWWCNGKLVVYRNTPEMFARAIAYLRSDFDGRNL